MSEYSASPAFLKLIAHDLRWKIIQVLALSDLRVQELAQALGQPQNLVSYHLKKLHQAQVILEHHSLSDGREIYYGLDFDSLQRQLHTLGGLIHPALTAAGCEAGLLKPLRVLFVCTHNSARSQMAEGLLRAQAGGGLPEVFSAGTEPTQVHALAIRAMEKRGIDIRGQAAKSLAAYQDQAFDLVITVCDRAKETCPAFPGSPARIHWSIADPAEPAGTPQEQLQQFEAAAEQLATRVKYLLRGFCYIMG